MNGKTDGQRAGKAGIGQDSQNGCKNLVEMEIV